jgi:integrase
MAPRASLAASATSASPGKSPLKSPCSLHRGADQIQQNHIRPAGMKVGLEEVGWHTCHHSYRSFLDETGAPIGVQQRLMRHAQVSTTMNTYGT